MSTAVHTQGAGPPASHDRIFEVAPPEELLYSISADGSRKFMHPVVRKGHYWHIRRRIAYALMVLFFALPLIPIGGHPAVLLDLSTVRFHLFGANTAHGYRKERMSVHGIKTLIEWHLTMRTPALLMQRGNTSRPA